jgi:hypothetical protein
LPIEVPSELVKGRTFTATPAGPSSDQEKEEEFVRESKYSRASVARLKV